VNLTVRVTETDAARLYDLAKAWDMPATDVHRAALKRYLNAESPVAVLRTPEVIQTTLDPGQISLAPDPPVEASPKVLHRHKPAPDPVRTRFDKGVRMVTPVCLICGEVLAERRG
jgi:hypothetical protein